jgi:HAD superfamily hydrolase (TIGR01509 family)
LIRAVIFDMDGVVVDSEPLYQQAEERLFREYGVTIPPEDWKLFRGCTEKRFYRLVHERYHIRESADVLRRKGREYVLSAFEADLEFKDGFTALHSRLREHYRLGLVTSTPNGIYSQMDKKLRLSRYFDEVITAETTTHNKPHPEPYLVAMERLSVSPLETAVIEDSILGLQSARSSGAWTIALAGSVPLEDMPPVHALVRSLDEISPKFIAALTRRPPEVYTTQVQ